MRRIAALACLLAAAALMPVQAEAAKLRFGGRSSAAPASKTSRSLVILPGAAGVSRAKAAEANMPERVPFPPAAATQREEPVVLRLSASDGAPKPWCRSEVVVGGFCILN
ncbi:hypothetical protein ARD30_09925 [Bosea thiooxidans]|uniref:Uncharacterized protein n=1 Tax=Bosea thiooxidans TaxID=53254 RepID=A0A0Q3KNM3_9HYPH|nr:hypothetical protein [Bosea thiooxidans]KQK31291.1 hypothetical protein ARD30_09925 [Bosea thiooxidans]